MVSVVALATALACAATPAFAQRADENAVRQAGDAFGTNIGNERVGLYSATDARGFSPTAAGNVRLEGLYFDMRTAPSNRLVASSQVRVGLTAQNYPFPAPTGVIDYALRPVGDAAVNSLLVQAGPHGAYGVEYDAQGLIVPGRFGVAFGLYTRREEDAPRDTANNWGFSVAPRWRPMQGVEIRPFYAFTRRENDKATEQIFVGGPAQVLEPNAVNYAPDWTGTDNTVETFGVLGSGVLSENWTLRAGLFEYKNWDAGPISDSYLNVSPTGIAQIRRFAHQHEFDHVSISGETRLTGVFSSQTLRHTINMSLRGRAVDRNFGGAAIFNVPNAPIGEFQSIPEPSWTFGPTLDDSVRQYSAGVSYGLARRGLGEISFGAQQVDYEKTVTAPNGADSVSSDRPLFWNGAFSLNLSERLVFYAAFTRGLEEAPVAPDVATNASEAPPAIRTRQSEFGFRYILTPRLRLVLGYFDVEKPYFNLDSGRVWRELGVERHSGVEASLTGEIARGLNVVAGWVNMEPRVSGEAVNAGIIGDDPIGQPHNTGRVNVDWRLPWNPALSFDAALNFYGGRPILARRFPELGNQQLRMRNGSPLDVGFRYRFDAAGHHTTLRGQILNVNDAKRFVTGTTGGQNPNPGLRYTLTLTTDF